MPTTDHVQLYIRTQEYLKNIVTFKARHTSHSQQLNPTVHSEDRQASTKESTQCSALSRRANFSPPVTEQTSTLDITKHVTA